MILRILFQKCKGRVVLRGDIVKDESGSYAVFTEQGLSASQMTDKRRTLYQLTPRLKWKMHITVKKILSQKVHIFAYVYRNTNGQNHGPVWKTQSFLLREICSVILWQDYFWEGNLRKYCWNTVGRRFPIGNAYSYTVKRGYSYLCMWMTSNWLERNKTLIRCGKYSIKNLIWENQHLSLCCHQLV